MSTHIAETAYPLTFRRDLAHALGDQLQHQKSVELVGMKRVGINNFLRFFLFHQDIKKQYMPQDGKRFFMLVDLNDLIEREIFPFWRLAFKRIADAVEASTLPEEIKKKISSLFVASIQTGDLFLTYDGVKEALALLSEESLYPTLFLTRFDRLKDAATPEFFSNLQALKDATHQKLSYVFTSYRELDGLVPQVFHRKDMTLFSSVMYVTPTDRKDSETILETIQQRYQLSLSEDMRRAVVTFAGGHVQYLQLCLLTLSELGKKTVGLSEEELLKLVLADERVTLQSEELWESLAPKEKTFLIKTIGQEKLTAEEKEKGKYLFDTGILSEEKDKLTIFSPLFAAFLEKQQTEGKEGNGIEFSKKEHMLFSFLEQHTNDICEREEIVDIVWPEYKEYGVSDWSIDRLVARVRKKLKKQKSMYEILTIRTRGYKLITK